MNVFRDTIEIEAKKCGLVGFDRENGIDYLAIVSWEGGEAKKVYFELAAVPALIELIQHAMNTKARPNERSCYAFAALHPDEIFASLRGENNE